MRFRFWLIAALLIALPVWPALTGVEVGGELRIRMRDDMRYRNPSGAPARVLIPNSAVLGRPIGASGLGSRYRFDDEGEDRAQVESQTRFYVAPEFTDGVSARVELEVSESWGTDFRSDPITGRDRVGEGETWVLQSYLEADGILGRPVRLRAGRQTLMLGKGWLVGDRISGVLGISFDAVRATYDQNDFRLDAWWSKLAERTGTDSDVDFHGLYGTYSGFDGLQISAYWMHVRDGERAEATRLGPGAEWLEDVLGLDDYPATSLHTLGARLWGESGALDYDWEFAWQFGNAAQPGAGFVPVGGIYGDDDARFDALGTDLEIGYTVAAPWSPRIFVGAAWYEGHDRRASSPLAWLNPFREGQASVSFNRLFADSSAKYAQILDGGQVLSNFAVVRGGAEFSPSEKLDISVELGQFWVDEVFQRPRFPGPFLGSWTEASRDDLGLLILLKGRYALTPDLWLRLRWEYFFTGSAIADGSFVDRNGLGFLQGSDADDASYIELMLGLQF